MTFVSRACPAIESGRRHRYVPDGMGNEAHPDLTSGDLARATGNTVRTIRFYEEQGLIKPAEVSDGGHRRYTAEELERLRLIGDLRELGLSLSDIKSMLDLRAGCDSAAEFAARFHAVLAEHIVHAQRRIERLRRVRRELVQARAAVARRLSCESEHACPCAVAAVIGAPRIVKVLAQDGLCHHPDGSRIAAALGLRDDGTPTDSHAGEDAPPTTCTSEEDECCDPNRVGGVLDDDEPRG
jgi:DNA-binding transcriptional MerR regulator